MHLAGFDHRWVSRELIWAVFHYAFVQLKCESLFGQIRSRNKQAIDFTEKFGFVYEADIPDVYPDGEGLIIYRLRAADCRWLTFKGNGGPHGRKGLATTSS